MIDFGAANDHNKYITFGDSSVIGYTDGFCGLLFAARVKLKSAAGTWGYLVGKQGAASGWGIRFNLGVGTQPEFYYNFNIVPTWRTHTCTTALIVGDWYSVVFSWRGDRYGYWYLNGAYVNTTDSGIPDREAINPLPANDFHVCGAGGFVNRGAAVEMDNVILNPGLSMKQAGIAAFAEDYHAGYIRPELVQDRPQRSRASDPGVLGPWFWWTGEYTPGYNTVKHKWGGHEPGATPAGAPADIVDHCNSPPWIFLDLGGAHSMSAGAKPAETKTGKMPTKLYVEVAARNRTYLGLKLELPDDIDMGFASAALPTSEQEYELKVLNWSPISRNVSDKDYRLTPVETSIVVADRGRVLSKLLAGKLDGRAEGSPATIKLMSPRRIVDPASWMTVYEGELRRWQPRGNLPEITLYLGPNDKPMRDRSNLGKISRDLYPSVPTDIEGQEMQMIYGTFDSLIGGGPISCPKVARDGKRHLVSAGMVTPLQVYQAGTMLDPQSGATEYQIVRCQERGGRWFTEISPVADAGSDEITVDMEGAAPSINDQYEGYPYSDFLEDWRHNVPITNPAEQLLHFLVNFVFGFYEQGSWLMPSITMPIDFESFIVAASWFKMRGMKGRAVIYGNETGYQLINRWARQWKIPVFWNIAGKIAVRPDDFAVVRGPQTNLIDREHGLSNLATMLKDDALADEVLIRHNYDWINNEFDDETRAKDLSRDYGIRKDFNQDWSAV